MKFLPETIPSIFQSTYSPIVDPGSPRQIEYLARLFHTQLKTSDYKFDVKCNDLLPSIKSNSNEISSKKMKLLSTIKPIEYNEMERMSIDSFNRILHIQSLFIL